MAPGGGGAGAKRRRRPGTEAPLVLRVASARTLAGGGRGRGLGCGVEHLALVLRGGGLLVWAAPGAGAGVGPREGSSPAGGDGPRRKVHVLSGVEFAEAACGWGHTAALLASGEVLCWGLEMYDEAALAAYRGDPQASLLPERQGFATGAGFLSALTAGWRPAMFAVEGRVDAVAAGWNFVVAKTAAGALWTWGKMSSGGAPPGQELSVLPREVALGDGGARVASIACGSHHAAAVTAAGEVFTWGENRFGQLGHGDRGSFRASPRRVGGELEGARVTQVACSQHTLALCDGGQVYSWGCASKHQLGHGRRKHVKSPREVRALRGLECTWVGCGLYHSLSRTRDGSLFFWGTGVFGAEGHYSFEPAEEPIHIGQVEEGAVLGAGGLQPVWVAEADDSAANDGLPLENLRMTLDSVQSVSIIQGEAEGVGQMFDVINTDASSLVAGPEEETAEPAAAPREGPAGSPGAEASPPSARRPEKGLEPEYPLSAELVSRKRSRTSPPDTPVAAEILTAMARGPAAVVAAPRPESPGAAAESPGDPSERSVAEPQASGAEAPPTRSPYGSMPTLPSLSVASPGAPKSPSLKEILQFDLHSKLHDMVDTIHSFQTLTLESRFKPEEEVSEGHLGQTAAGGEPEVFQSHVEGTLYVNPAPEPAAEEVAEEIIEAAPTPDIAEWEVADVPPAGVPAAADLEGADAGPPPGTEESAVSMEPEDMRPAGQAGAGEAPEAKGEEMRVGEAEARREETGAARVGEVAKSAVAAGAEPTDSGTGSADPEEDGAAAEPETAAGALHERAAADDAKPSPGPEAEGGTAEAPTEDPTPPPKKASIFDRIKQFELTKDENIQGLQPTAPVSPPPSVFTRRLSTTEVTPLATGSPTGSAVGLVPSPRTASPADPLSPGAPPVASSPGRQHPAASGGTPPVATPPRSAKESPSPRRHVGETAEEANASTPEATPTAPERSPRGTRPSPRARRSLVASPGSPRLTEGEPLSANPLLRAAAPAAPAASPLPKLPVLGGSIQDFVAQMHASLGDNGGASAPAPAPLATPRGVPPAAEEEERLPAPAGPPEEQDGERGDADSDWSSDEDYRRAEPGSGAGDVGAGAPDTSTANPLALGAGGAVQKEDGAAFRDADADSTTSSEPLSANPLLQAGAVEASPSPPPGAIPALGGSIQDFVAQMQSTLAGGGSPGAAPPATPRGRGAAPETARAMRTPGDDSDSDWSNEELEVSASDAETPESTATPPAGGFDSWKDLIAQESAQVAVEEGVAEDDMGTWMDFLSLQGTPPPRTAPSPAGKPAPEPSPPRPAGPAAAAGPEAQYLTDLVEFYEDEHKQTTEAASRAEPVPGGAVEVKTLLHGLASQMAEVLSSLPDRRALQALDGPVTAADLIPRGAALEEIGRGHKRKFADAKENAVLVAGRVKHHVDEISEISQAILGIETEEDLEAVLANLKTLTLECQERLRHYIRLLREEGRRAPGAAPVVAREVQLEVGVLRKKISMLLQLHELAVLQFEKAAGGEGAADALRADIEAAAAALDILRDTKGGTVKAELVVGSARPKPPQQVHGGRGGGEA